MLPPPLQALFVIPPALRIAGGVALRFNAGDSGLNMFFFSHHLVSPYSTVWVSRRLDTPMASARGVLLYGDRRALRAARFIFTQTY
jgi:hypothetical protein